jgi:glucose-1-phosphate cytidylyltransferase
MSSFTPDTVPIFILCGGLGTRLAGADGNRPKPLLEIGDQPIVTHIMRSYRRFGFRRFVLCTGHRHDVVSSYFLDYPGIANDFTVDLATREICYHQSTGAPDWRVTIAHTGKGTMTGARIARAAARYLGDSAHFGVTYGDGLTDADLGDEFAFHLSHRKLGTVLGVHPPSQFGCFDVDSTGVRGFAEKPAAEANWINGGFFFFRRGFLAYLDQTPDCVLEREPLQRLAREGELELYRYQGFWSCIDTVSDRDRVAALCEDGATPWLGPPPGLAEWRGREAVGEPERRSTLALVTRGDDAAD